MSLVIAESDVSVSRPDNWLWVADHVISTSCTDHIMVVKDSVCVSSVATKFFSLHLNYHAMPCHYSASQLASVLEVPSAGGWQAASAPLN